MSEKIEKTVEELQPVLTAIAQELSNVYTSGKALAQQELPQIAHEMISYGLWNSVIWLIFGFGCWYLAMRVWRIFRKSCAESTGAYDDGAFTATTFVASMGSFVVGTICVIDSFQTIAMTVFSPRLYLLKEAISLVGKLKGS